MELQAPAEHVLTLDIIQRIHSREDTELALKTSLSRSFTGFFQLPSAGQLLLHKGMMNDKLAKNLEYYMFFILSSLKVL